MSTTSTDSSRKAGQTTFEQNHEKLIRGKLTMFDRVIFKGHFQWMHGTRSFRHFLFTQGVPLRDFSRFVPEASDELDRFAKQVAETMGRPFKYLDSAHTRGSGYSKEQIARDIAEADGVEEGLICVLSVVEPCSSIGLKKEEKTGHLAVVHRHRKCRHFYYYFMDREFGFMHVRLQSWFPMQIQIYINGREWLCRQLDQRGVGYTRYDNAILDVDDLPLATALCKRFQKRKWVRVLDSFALRVNPWYTVFRQHDFPGYYWVTDQVEVATDVMFSSRADLQKIMPDLLEHACLHMSAHDILRYMGGQRLCSELCTDHKARPEGRRVKHRLRRNSIKMYDKHSVLRIETTINNHKQFRVLRAQHTKNGRKVRWMPMRKGVVDFWRICPIAERANLRYLEALGHVAPKGEAIRELDGLCQSRTVDGRRHAKFNPVSAADCRIFEAVLHGEHMIYGFRNRDLVQQLYRCPAKSAQERKRRCARTSRIIAKLRGHRLIAKVPNARLYRVTAAGHRAMSAAIHFRKQHYPAAS